MEYVVALFDYEDRRVVGGCVIPNDAIGRRVAYTTPDNEECLFEYTALVPVRPDLTLLLAEQTTGPPKRLNYFHHGESRRHTP